jgi:hypothetical protein
MSSVQAQIVAYVVGSSCLATSSGKPSGLVVGRGTAKPIQAADNPRIDVYVGPERTEAVGLRGGGSGGAGNPMQRWVTVFLECRAVAGTSPDTALDPIKVWAEQRMYADETFGNLAAGIWDWRTEQDARHLDQSYALATIAAEVRYITNRGSP